MKILEVDNKDKLVSFYTDMLLKQKKDSSIFHRDDYREAAKLALILIGGELPEGQTMMAYNRTLSGRSTSAGGRGKARRPGLSLS